MCLTCDQFYEKAIKDKYDTEVIGKIVKHMSYENLEFTTQFSKLLLNNFNSPSYEDGK